MFREIRKVDRRIEQRCGLSILGFGGFHAQRERGQSQLLVFELDHGAYRLAGENMFREHEPQSDARKGDGRKDSGPLKEGAKACKNQVQWRGAGIKRGWARRYNT